MKILLFSKPKVEVQIGFQVFLPTPKNPVVLSENDIVKVFPINSGLPFCFKVNEDCEFVKTTLFPNFVFVEIVDVPKCQTNQFVLFKKFSCGNVSVVGSPYVFNVNLPEKNYSQKLPENLVDISLSDTKFALCVQGEVDLDGFLAIFHKKSHNFFCVQGSVEFDGTNLKAIKDEKTLSRHGKLITAEITEEDVVVKSEETVYLDKAPKIVPPFLIHLAFFEAVKEKDFNLCSTFLQNDLAKNLTSDHLTEFFGTFDSVKVINEQGKTKVAVITDKSKTFATARVFELKLQDGKIFDIQED